MITLSLRPQRCSGIWPLAFYLVMMECAMLRVRIQIGLAFGNSILLAVRIGSMRYLVQVLQLALQRERGHHDTSRRRSSAPASGGVAELPARMRCCRYSFYRVRGS